MPPSGWPRAMAPPFGLTVLDVRLQLLGPGEHDRRERLVDLEDVDVVDRQPGALEQALGGVDRAGEHQHGVDADEAGVDDARLGRQPERVGLLLGHQQHRGRAVGDLRARCRRCARRPRRATGFSAASVSSVVSRRPSSRPTWWVVPGGLAVLVEVGGVDRRRSWPSKRSSAHARAARCWLRRPKASVSARVMPHLSAMRSAPSNCEVIS